jgi:hypothetical protein
MFSIPSSHATDASNKLKSAMKAIILHIIAAIHLPIDVAPSDITSKILVALLKKQII